MPSRFKVVITDFLDHSPDAERGILGDLASIECLCAHHEEELAGRIEDADAVMIYHCLKFTAQSVNRLKQCTLLRSEGGDWSYSHAAPLPRLRSRVFGIVGLGRIGSAAALRAKALGMDVVYYDPYAPDGRDKSLGIRRLENLEELLAAVHVLSMHCPLTSETRHLINAETIEKMPRGSYLVNTSRGAVVDTSAIPAAIESGRLAGAAIDVLEHEPPAPNDPLIKAWRDPHHPAHHRLIVNPHSAFYSEQGLMDMRIKGAEACRRALLGLPLRNVVN
jgi:C-terminal binding protein